MAATAPHPTDQTLSSYGLGKLDDGPAEAVARHLGDCPDCRQRVAELSADSLLGKVRAARPDAGATSAVFQPDWTQGLPRTGAAPPPAETLPPGLADHPDYRIKKELGRGGMGVVYLAHNNLMGRDEVLKVMSRHLVEKPGVLDRFLREIRAVARLRHDNIVAAYSALRLGESIVFAMEYVEGLDLAKMIKAKGPLPVAHACLFVHQAALGLQHAHEEGLVHRDMKPGNLMLSRKGARATVKVLDFGLAKASSEEGLEGALTSQGQALGTPDYIAPEQIMNAPGADIRADIYSLGGTLFHLLTGRPPFQAKTLYDIYQAHISRDADPLNLIRPEVPAELAALVAKMMAKDPNRRFQTPMEVAEALLPFCKTRPTQTLPELSRAATAGGRPSPIVTVPFSPEPSTATPTPTPSPEVPVTPGPGSLVALDDRDLIEAPLVAGKPDRPRRARPVAAAGVLLSALLVAWLAGVFRVKTRDGVIILTNVPADAHVLVDGKTITFSRPSDDRPVTIQAGPGEHEVAVEKDGFRTFGTRVSFETSGTEVVAVHMESLAGPEENSKPTAAITKVDRQVTVERPPSAGKLTASRDSAEPPGQFQPGATWVGSLTYEGSTFHGEVWPYVLTITERSSDRFKAEATIINMAMTEIFTTLTGTIRQNQIAAKAVGPAAYRTSMTGELTDRAIHWEFEGTGRKGDALSGQAALSYQGPLEPRPPTATAGSEGSPEGSERLKIIGRWDHRPGNARRTVELMANGSARMFMWRGTWTLDGDRLVVRWPTDKAAGQAWLDTLTLNPARTTYEGSNKQGVKITGSRAGGGGYNGMPKVNYDLAGDSPPQEDPPATK